ncbi:MAG: formate dehydrogenase subunit alpha [Eubacteriaceae bacterium]|nr:formate dehydrogenase subunit alpha [Eubacteriaceae bacterium]
MDNIKITINGKECCVAPGTTIFMAAKKNGIDIPSLCFDERVATVKGDCGVCVVEVEGIEGSVLSCKTAVTEGMVVTTKSPKLSAERKAALDKILAEHKGDCRPPCAINCPAHTDCQGYVGLIANGQFREAIKLIKEKIPLPGSIGRVCPHPCEENCRRALVDEALSIAWLKRFAADMDAEDPYLPPIEPETGKKVAVIGGGPMGLSTAYFLRQKGHGVTVFEAMPNFGGMLRYGIPEYRLPKRVVDAEAASIGKMGVVLKPNTKVGVDVAFEDIRKEFDAVVLAIGAWVSTGTGCPGEDADGVVGGIDFLRKVIRNEEQNIGDAVAIVGGGNTAMDACRTAVRLGAKKVYNIYRRTKDEMPADALEIREADEEGVIFKNLTNPIEYIKDENGHVKQVLLQVMELGEPDASGRRSPMPIEGKTELLDVNTVILAIGQAVDATPFDTDKTRKKAIAYDKETFMTSIEGVFAGGDCGNDKISIAVEAIADAVKASVSVDSYLKGGNVTYKQPFTVVRDDINEKTFEDRERLCRPTMEQLEADERKDNFEEVVKGYTAAQAIKEGNRCLECGCGKYYECKLVKYADEYCDQWVKPSEAGIQNNFEYNDEHPFVLRDPNKCIKCDLCLNMCKEVMGAEALEEVVIDGKVMIRPVGGVPLLKTKCVSCGNCVSVCPTGALQARTNNGKMVPLNTRKVRTTCAYCGVGCQIDLCVVGNRIVDIQPAFGPSNGGILCVKGKFAYEFVNHPDRLKTPLIKKNGEFVEASWEEAFDLIENKMKSIKAQYGADALAGLSSARVSNEENYLFMKFMRAAIGTNNVDHCARLCHASTVAGLASVLGSGAMTNSIPEVLDADAILVQGSNTTIAHPVLGTRIIQAVKKGAKLIVIDPRKIPLTEIAEIHLQIKPGTNIAITNGMINVIIEEGLADMDYINSRTEGFEEIKEMVKDYTPEKVAEICGVDPEDIRKAARLYAKADKAPIYYSMGVTQFASGTNGVIDMSNLCLVSGKMGKYGCGVNPLRGQNNVQGACDLGALPTDLTAYQKVANPEALKKFADFWGVELSANKGLTVTEMMKAITEDKVKSLFIMGENPMISDPDINHVEEALEKCEFLVVQDIFMTETARYADVVLPASCYAEKDGTFTNTERRVQRIRKAVQAPGEVKEDWIILTELLNRFGVKCSYDSPKDIMEEIRKLTPSYAGISYERLENETLQWPCPNEEHPGTPVLHIGKFSRGDRGLIKAVAYTDPIEPTDSEYPITFTTGRILYHYHTRTMTGKSKGLNKISGHSYVEIHPEDAKPLGINDLDTVIVESRRGFVKVEAHVTPDVKKGVAFMPFHFADGPANKLTQAAIDPVAKIPEFKVSAVRIRKA